jgi:hypothetical protein
MEDTELLEGEPPITWSPLQECPDCGALLDRSQPEFERPDRVLGVCRDCEKWWVLDPDRPAPVVALEWTRRP